MATIPNDGYSQGSGQNRGFLGREKTGSGDRGRTGRIQTQRETCLTPCVNIGCGATFPVLGSDTGRRATGTQAGRLARESRLGCDCDAVLGKHPTESRRERRRWPVAGSAAAHKKRCSSCVKFVLCHPLTVRHDMSKCKAINRNPPSRTMFRRWR